MEGEEEKNGKGRKERYKIAGRVMKERMTNSHESLATSKVSDGKGITSCQNFNNLFSIIAQLTSQMASVKGKFSL